MTPAPWGDEGPSILKRPASVALDDEEKQTIRNKSAAKIPEMTMKEAVETMLKHHTKVTKLMTVAMVMLQKIKRSAVAKLCKPLGDEIKVKIDEMKSVLKDSRDLKVM